MLRSPDANVMIIERSASETDKGNVVYEKKAKRLNNGWALQLEVLAAEWADKAACYRWMHEKTETRYVSYNMYLTIPVIVLSTLTGTASFAVESLLNESCSTQHGASAIIGTVSLLTGMISTMANFLRYAQSSEAHRVSAISWGKFQRFVSTELALNPNERMDAMSFLKMARVEIDRLIEQSPMIPNSTIVAFKKEFKEHANLVVPEIAGGLYHTKIYADIDSRLGKAAAEAEFMLEQKEELLRSIASDDLDKYIVERTKTELVKLENELLGEVLRVAKETALQTVQGGEQNILSPQPTTSPNQVVLEVKE